MLVVQDGELVSESDNLDGQIGSTADQGDKAMEERQEDSEHGATVCHSSRQSSIIPRRTRFAVGTGGWDDGDLSDVSSMGVYEFNALTARDDVGFRCARRPGEEPKEDK